MRKLVSMLLALVMLCSMCLVPAIAEGQEPWEVNVYIGAPMNQPTSDNRMFKKIADEFGMTFNFEFLAGDLNESLGVKMSDPGTLPDLMDGGNSAEDLSANGIFVDLMPYISEEKTPNIYEYINPYLDRLLNDKGELFILPNYGRIYNDEIVNYCNGPAFYVQMKVLAWDNYPQIKTVNQYFDLLERYIAANPTDENGTPYSMFEILCDDWRAFCLFNPVQHLMGRPNDGDVIVDIDNNYKVDAFIIQDYAKVYYKKLNEMFRKGLINQDTFTQSFDQYLAKVSNGTVLGMFDQYWDFQDATNALKTAGKFDSMYQALPLVYDAEDVGGKVIEEHYMNGSVLNVNRGFGITTNCKDVERMVAFLEEMLSDRWQILLTYGEEGVDYSIENGRYVRTKEQHYNAADQVWLNANTAKVLWESLPKKRGTMNDGNSWDPALQPEIYNSFELTDYQRDFLKAYGYKVPADFLNSPIPIAPWGEAWQIDLNTDPAGLANDAHQALQSNERRDLPQVIMAADEAEFEAKWAAFVQGVEEIPVTDYVSFMQSAIDAIIEKTK